MLNIASRLLAQLRPQVRKPVQAAARALAHPARRRERCTRAWQRATSTLTEARRRTREAARDALHRLRTGCPRGVPTGFDVLVHPCTESCSLSARQVHGLILKYGQRYEEVRLKVRTMGEILGWSEATLRHAIKELRERKLLDVEERVGHDKRRIANRYRAHVVAPTKGAPIAATCPPDAAQRGTSGSDRSRTGILKALSPNAGSRLEETTKPAPLAPATSRSRKPPGSGGVSPASLEQALGAGLYQRLTAAHNQQLHALCTVVDKHRALSQPGMLRAAIEGLLAEKSGVSSPPAYLVGILRRQQQQLGAMQDEQAELEAQRAEMRTFDDPGLPEVERKLARLRDQIGLLTTAEEPPAAPVKPAHTAAPNAAPARPRTRPRTQLERAPEPPPASPTIVQAQAASGHLGWARGELGKLQARGSCAAELADQQRRVQQLSEELARVLERLRAEPPAHADRATVATLAEGDKQLALARAALSNLPETSSRGDCILRPEADSALAAGEQESEAALQTKLHEATTFVRLIARLQQLRALHPAATRGERDEIAAIEHDLRLHLAKLERQLANPSCPRGRAAQLAAQAAAIDRALALGTTPPSGCSPVRPGLRKAAASKSLAEASTPPAAAF